MTRGLTRRRLLHSGAAGAALLLAGLPRGVARAASLRMDDPKRGGTVVVGTIPGGREEGFDPHNSFGNLTSPWMHDLLYDPLLRLDPGGGPPRPSLAASWDVDDTGLTYTFHLREATFHDGSPITADDAVFSLERLKATHLPWISLPPISFEATDSRTVVVRLEHPWAPLLTGLAVGTASILPRKLVEEQKELFFLQPVGSGPFRLAEWETGSRIALAKHTGYWDGGKPYLDGAEVRIYPNAEDAAAAFTDGTVDILPVFPIDERPVLASQTGSMILESERVAPHGLTISTTIPPFDDKLLRQAIAYALDRAAILATGYDGVGDVATTYIPPTMFGHDAEATGRAYDPEKATALAAASSGKDGFEAVLLKGVGEWTEAKARVIGEQLAVIGGRIVASVTPDVLPAVAAAGRIGILSIFGDPAGPDPDDLSRMWVWSGGFGSQITGYRNDRADQLIEAGASEIDPTKRQAIYRDLQALVDEEVPFVPLVYPRNLTAIKLGVEGFKYRPFDALGLLDTWRDDM